MEWPGGQAFSSYQSSYQKFYSSRSAASARNNGTSLRYFGFFTGSSENMRFLDYSLRFLFNAIRLRKCPSLSFKTVAWNV